MENPFRYGGVVRGPHFADRQSELAELEREMHHLGRVFLVSPRRYGKTCLLFNLMDRLRMAGVAVAYVDLNACPDLRQFAAGWARLTAAALETNTDRLLKLLSGMQRLRPKVSVGPDGTLTAGVEVVGDGRETIPALLEAVAQGERLARRKGKKLVVILDEFSDIDMYNGLALEKALRAEIQRHEHVGYIFCGSQQSMMLSMIQDRRRPFYKLGRLMSIGPIPRKAYGDFVSDWLTRGGMDFKPGDMDAVFELAMDVPYNVQRLCHIMWEQAREGRSITREMIRELPLTVVRQDAPHYEQLWQTVTPPQRLLLSALQKTPAAKPFSRDFQMTHGIGPSSSIKAHLNSLLKKGVLYREPSGTYRFTDGFLPFWIAALENQN